MLKRTLNDRLVSLSRQFPVISITGPRQAGKTTLAKTAFPGHEYVNLEKPDERELAIDDPNGFFGRFHDGVILDEIQRVPELLSYIQVNVDAEDRPGRFVLTGSQQYHLMESVTQTLAGRTAMVSLLPFSMAELSSSVSPDPSAVTRLPESTATPSHGLFHTIFTGFYPRIHDKGLNPHDWLGSYYQTYVERDVRGLANIGNLETFQRFVRLCAGRSGQLLNLSALADDAGISHTTAQNWLSILKAGFIIHLLTPHHVNFRKRLVKTPKLYFFDTGLLCYLLGIRSPDELMIHPLRGPIFETYVISELYKAFINRGEVPPLYFWRDQIGHEVDVVIDHGGVLTPVEVKSGETINSSMFDGLKYFMALGPPAGATGALIYGGRDAHVRNGITVRPWHAVC